MTESLDWACPICFEEITVDNEFLTPCSHKFCTSCIDTLSAMNQIVICPLCRNPFVINRYSLRIERLCLGVFIILNMMMIILGGYETFVYHNYYLLFNFKGLCPNIDFTLDNFLTKTPKFIEISILLLGSFDISVGVFSILYSLLKSENNIIGMLSQYISGIRKFYIFKAILLIGIAITMLPIKELGPNSEYCLSKINIIADFIKVNAFHLTSYLLISLSYLFSSF